MDKCKEVDGILEHHLRFISILTPLNMYMRKLCGGSWLLPQASLLNMVVLGEGEFMWVDGEDRMSCFNLFVLPDAWRVLLLFFQESVEGHCWRGST